MRYPTLILWGEEDKSLPLSMGREVRAQLPRADLHPIEDAKHSPHQERAHEVSTYILAFLAGGTR